jgi:molybdenum cofactor cytidylyltransferase
MTATIPILILAAGRSARMRGRDKLAEPVDGIPLLRAQAQKALTVSPLVLVALPAPDHPRANLLDGLPVTLLTVPESGEGMGGTLRGAVARLPACPAFLLLLADLPELTAADLALVCAARQSHPDHVIWRGTTASGAPGHPILFDATLIPRFTALQGDRGGESLVNPLREQTCLIPLSNDRARRDLDTPEDWAAWRAETGR